MTDYEKCKFYSVKYKSTSTMGNPSYWICFSDSEGNFHRGYTASNASAGYTANNYQYAENGSPIYLKYHFTRKTGACIIDFIKHNTPVEAAEATKNQN